MAHWFSRLSPTPTFPNTTGPYSVGTVDVEIAASELQDSSASTFAPSATIAFRAYYPCETPENSAKPVYWVQAPQKSTISAYARFLGAGSTLSNLLSWVPVGTGLYHAQISAHRDARLHNSPAASGRWPVVVFSHGLGGSRNAYSQLCASVASEGQIVLAPEHRDGSCPISYVRATDNTAATTVDYKRFSHEVSPEVYEGRDEQLKTRLWELNLLHRALQKMESGEALKNLDQKPSKQDGHSSTTTLAQFQGRLAINEPGSITWAGHSFGATTTVQFIKSIFYHPANPHYHNPSLQSASSTPSPLVLFEPSAALLSQITPNTPTILLDIWALPLNSPSTAALKSQCMPAFTVVTDGADGHRDHSYKSSPLLAVLSSAFVNWTSNFNDVKELLSHPSAAGRRGPMTPLAQSRPAAHIFYPIDSAHLGQSDFGVLFPLVTKYLSKAQEPERTLQLNVRAIIQVLQECGNTVVGKPDYEILSREAGRVRGWIAVHADERGEKALRREGKKSANAETEALRQA